MYTSKLLKVIITKHEDKRTLTAFRAFVASVLGEHSDNKILHVVLSHTLTHPSPFAHFRKKCEIFSIFTGGRYKVQALLNIVPYFSSHMKIVPYKSQVSKT